ncbi:MAG: DUF3306 domain-containing protein [Pseudomonadota bacterium]
MSDDDFLSRWSRRKRAVAEEQEVPQAEVAEPATDASEPQSEVDEQALLAELNLPLPETLKPGDDFSAFMADGVPQFLRKRALRVLWRSNPVLANLDGLNDYDDDFNSPELTQKVLATAYQVGRGIVTRLEEDPLENPAEETTEDPEPPPAQEEQVTVKSEENRPVTLGDIQSEEAEEGVRPRRMRFMQKS